MRYQLLPAVLFVLLSASISSAGPVLQRELRFEDATWTITSRFFRLEKVIDKRKDRRDAGKINGPKPTQLVAVPELDQAIAAHLDGRIIPDTVTAAPFDLIIDKFYIADDVTGNKHVVRSDLKFRMERDIDGTRISVYESTFTPRQTATGSTAPAGFYEKTIQEALRLFLEGFEKWAAANHENPYFCNHISVSFRDSTSDTSRQDPDTILWSGNRKLTWDDFQGKDTQNSPYSAQSNCVFTLKTIPAFSSDTLQVREIIGPIFTRGASWVHPDALQDTLLLHEQLHFDICELYARRFRSEVAKSNLGLLTFDRQINDIFRKSITEYQLRQDAYDSETSHGTISEKQIAWMNAIRQELSELEEFRTD